MRRVDDTRERFLLVDHMDMASIMSLRYGKVSRDSVASAQSHDRFEFELDLDFPPF